MFDLVIKNGRIIDGTGTDARTADIVSTTASYGSAS